MVPFLEGDVSTGHVDAVASVQATNRSGPGKLPVAHDVVSRDDDLNAVRRDYETESLELLAGVNEVGEVPTIGFLHHPFLDGVRGPDTSSGDLDLGLGKGLVALDQLVGALTRNPEQLSNPVDVDEVVHVGRR